MVFNERTNTLLYKNISHTLFSKGLMLCVRDELETGTDCYILTQVLLTIAALLSHLGCGLLNRGSLRAQSPLSAAGSQFDILSPTDYNWFEPPRAPGYIIVWRPSASAVLPFIYTGASTMLRKAMKFPYVHLHEIKTNYKNKKSWKSEEYKWKKKKKPGETIHTNTYIMTFNTNKIFKEIKIGYQKM